MLTPQDEALVRCRDRNRRLFKVPGQVCSRRSLVEDVEFEVKVPR